MWAVYIYVFSLFYSAVLQGSTTAYLHWLLNSSPYAHTEVCVQERRGVLLIESLAVQW